MTEATEGKGKMSWWQTVPGLLTGAAAVITAVAGLVGVLYQNGLLGKGPAPAPATTRPPEGVQVAARKPEQAAAGSETVRAGHYAFRLLDVKTEPYGGETGVAKKLLLRLSVRVTDVAGTADYVDRRTIRLAVDGTESDLQILIPPTQRRAPAS
jgi:hypothetical protein